MSLLKPLALLVMATTLSACVSTDNNKNSNNAYSEQVISPSSWTSQIKESVLGPEKWLESFNDPLLMQLIAEGKEHNLDLQIAAASMNKAWLLAEKSGVALKPTVDLSLARTQSGSMTGGDSNASVGVGLQASWELDVWGRIQSGIDSAKANAESSQADYIFAEHSLSANIAKSYFKVIEAKLQANITEQNVSILKKHLRITQVKYSNGFSSAQDIALNKANLASAQDQLIATITSKRNAIRSLEVLLGRYPNATLDIADVLPSLPEPPPPGIPSSILERRPDLISAERQVAAAYSATAQAKAAQLPSFSLTSSVNGSSSALSDVLNPSNLIWQLAGNVLAPIYDGGRKAMDVEIATTDQTQALANYKSKALVAFSEVEDNLDQGVNLAKREVALTQAYQHSKKAYRIAELRYKEGESELLDTLQIQQQAISAQSNLLSIKRTQLEQRVNLYLSLGGSW